MTIAALDELFTALRGRLRPLIAALRRREAPPVPAALRATIAADTQEALGRELMGVLGFDFARGRLDRAVHPFCGGAGVDDVRVTSRYADNDLLSGLLAIIHETGHALYEQGRDPAYADQPVSRARSMGWHESQSLLWENQVGRSPEFWRFLLPWLGERLPAYKDADHGAIVRALARVDFDNTIRVEADELTYPLHVILRYEIERDLFADAAADRLRIEDLPEIWDSRTLNYLGVFPDDAAHGILQDVHWSGGAFGYFPSYTIGAVLGAQLFATAKAQLPGLGAGLAAGDTAALRGWLKEQVHRRGSRLGSDALARAITGEGLRPEPFLDYVEAKFTAAYGAAPAAT
jgi:carboxypeptidase Taq